MKNDALTASARSVQRRLEEFYALEAGPDVSDFVHAANGTSRETLIVRHNPEGLELALVLPISAGDRAGAVDDGYLQLVEGVSHFVYLAERARIDLSATELELELQAEVDKFVVLAFEGSRLATDRAEGLRRTLYESVEFVHAPESERGQRYRMANDLAARLATRLAERSKAPLARRFLQRFYRCGQGDKIRLATAA